MRQTMFGEGGSVPQWLQRMFRRAIVHSVCLNCVLPAHALIFFSTGDPGYNTNAPGGVLTNSGWQYQGAWSSFCGTVIASNAFITAKHVGGSVAIRSHFNQCNIPRRVPMIRRIAICAFGE